MRVGVAFGSGSMHGMAHVGVIQALEASGLEVSVVSGTSVGAIVGSLWASGLSADAIARISARHDWDDTGRWSPGSDGLMSNGPIRDELSRLLRGRPIETWPRRFGAVATQLANGQRRVLKSGDGAAAVQASSAMPVLFRPVTIAGEKLGDGALVEPVPVDAARELGADFVIAIDVAYRPYEEPAGGLAGQAFQALHILTNQLAQRQLRDADFALRLDVHRRFMACGAPGLVIAGREAMQRELTALSVALAGAAARRGVGAGP
jgi:NTE family protein